MIQVEHLVFEYPGTRALDDVTFSIERGSIAALVGPNGAGKTTLLRCLAALEQPLAGSLSMDGVNVLEHPRDCHRITGYLSDFFGLYDDLTVNQCLTYVARAHHVADNEVADRVATTATRLEIADRLNTKAGALSRGLRQRLAIAQAIVHGPRMLLLDEPASGLDPEARHALSELLKRLRSEGMTIIVSSHILAELESYCTAMVVLRGGRVIEHTPFTQPQIEASTIMLELASPVEDLRATLESIPQVADVTVKDARASFRFTGDVNARHQLLANLLERGLEVAEFSLQQANLQQAYLELVKQNSHGTENP